MEKKGGQFESAEGGQFESAEGGQFESAEGGQFKTAEGGQFDRSLQYTAEQNIFRIRRLDL